MKALAAAVALAGLLAAGCASKPAPEQVAPAAVRVAAVRELAFVRRLDLSGSVVASRQAAVGAVVPGRITAVLVRVGDVVAAGDPIARIDDASYRAAYAQAAGSSGAAQANVAAARAQADAARTRLSLAQTTAHRMAVLFGEGAISRQEFDEAQSGFAAARAALAQAQAAIGAASGAAGEAKAALAAAAVPLGEAVVRAPFDGVILARDVDPGAVVGAAAPIVTVEDNAHLELDVMLPEDEASAVRPHLPARVAVDALGGRSVEGRVRAVVASENAALRSVLVKIDLPTLRGLYAGMFARVALDGPARIASAVPAEALVSRAGQDGVFAIDGRRVAFIPVLTGATQDRWIEIRDLPASVHQVAVAGVEHLTDGAPVAILR